MRQRDRQQAPGTVGRHVAAALADLAVNPVLLVHRQDRHPGLLQDAFHELPVRVGDHLAERPGAQPGGFRVPIVGGGDQHVHAVGAALHVAVDPA